MNLFKDYYCTTYRESINESLDFHRYLFINRLDTTTVASFRIEIIFQLYTDILLLRYNDQWETYAPLIIEYAINKMNINIIYLNQHD